MEPGALLDGKYRLVRRLGQGGMGEVWAAEDLSLNRQVAVKIVLSNLGTNQEVIARLRREAQAAASLQHPGITVVHAMGEHEGHPFVVMELLNGRDFMAILEANPNGIPVAHAVSLAAQVADALAYAHRNGVVHRDIKPANLMELTDGRVKICDFGIARFADAAPDLTPMGMILGTPPYTAPEQYRGGPVDGRSDLYSFGCTLYALLTGRPPFTGPSIAAFMNQHLHEPPPRPSELRPDIPAELENLVLGMLAKDPADRPSMEEVLARLNALNSPAPAPPAAPAATLPFAPDAPPPFPQADPAVLPPVGPPPAAVHQAPLSPLPPPSPPSPAAQALNEAVNRLRSSRAPVRAWRAVASGAGWLLRAPGGAGRDLDPALRRDGLGLVLLIAALTCGGLLWSQTELTVTTKTADFLRGVFGVCAYVLPVLLFLLAARIFRSPERREANARIVSGSVVTSLAVLGVIHISAETPNPLKTDDLEPIRDAGGVVGWMVGAPLEAALTPWGAIPLLLVLGGLGLLIATATPLNELPERIGRLLGLLTSDRDRTPEGQRQGPANS